MCIFYKRYYGTCLNATAHYYIEEEPHERCRLAELYLRYGHTLDPRPNYSITPMIKSGHCPQWRAEAGLELEREHAARK